MFDYIKGELVSKNFPYCTVECNNIGYSFLVNQRTISSLDEIGENVKIYSKLIHKEDIMYLCGFKNKQDRTIFDILTTVSGVGVKVAFALLDEFETGELVDIVINEDSKKISRTKGVGPKMAQKIVLELKDKLTKVDVVSEIVCAKNSNSIVSNETIQQASAILQSLGYTQKEYQNALDTALTQLTKDDSQELIKEALKILSIF